MKANRPTAEIIADIQKCADNIVIYDDEVRKLMHYVIELEVAAHIEGYESGMNNFSNILTNQVCAVNNEVVA